MSIIKKLLFLLASFQVLCSKAQVPCDASNSPTFSLTASHVTLATTGYCGMQINIMGGSTIPPGGPISYSIIIPGQGSIIIGPPPTIMLTPGIYTVTVTDNTNLCKTTKTVEVTVLQAPSISVVASNTVCSGNMATLTASGANTYTWSTGANTPSILVNPLSTTIYSVLGTGTNVCSNMVSTSLSVTVYPSPTINIAGVQIAICLNESITFSASGAKTYTWNGTQIGANITVTPLVSSSYTVIGTAENGCEGNRQISVIVLPCTSLMKSKMDDEELIIFPVPANDQIELNISNAAFLKEFPSLSIYNSSGVLIHEEEINVGHRFLKISTDHLPNGIYSLRLTTNSKETTNKCFVISR